MYQDPATFYQYAVSYFDGSVTKRQWFNDRDIAIQFGKAMLAMDFTNVEVAELVPIEIA